MRITTEQAFQIKQVVHQIFGEQASVWLFGSRVNDNAQGGDVDLLIKTQTPLLNPAVLAAKVSVKVMKLQHGRKVDVVQAPNSTPQPIFDIAVQTGVLL
ncbi:nucleotidyltransferase domain-containing protein [Thiomicrorhabdus sp. Milos-T2]|uniref:nucleotidyltransferase domain-containing protein n=1 Tax=Thiomicrorhabdus sp. Milos-T2 TaxID=90814 RepID=UPI000494176F|nr:nucleotidyltransferase domain-containing protein [Thiomicrorhabdus sp. Milos-T2]